MRYPHSNFTYVIHALIIASLVFVFFAVSHSTNAAPTYTINYQGKLTNASNVAVPDGTYNMRFWLLTTSSIATTSAVWTEELTGTNKVQVTNGLFSIMLGSTTPLTSIDFNQALYLGVEIGGTTTPGWDGEMSPRKILGTVPAAFESSKLDGLDSTQFVRTDTVTGISSTSAATLFTITQNGTGDLLNLFDGATEVFSILDGGNVGVGTSSPAARFSVAGNSYFGGTFTATGTVTLSAYTGGILTTGPTGIVSASTTIGTSYLDASVILSSEIDSLSELETLTGIANILIENDIDASSELAALMDDETGTAGNLVFSGNPLLQGFRSNASSTIGDGTATGGLTISGNSTTTLNAYIGGLLGIGTTTPSAKLSITGTAGNTQNLLTIASSTGSTSLAVLASGDVEVANNLITAGVKWTARTEAETNQWASVTYGNGTFVAVSYDGTNRVMTSPDGITWTPRTAAAANAWGSVTYGNGLFVAVAQDGTNPVMTSSDGIAWTLRTAAEANTWTSVTYGNGLFVAVAFNGTNRVMTSPDGITWTSRSAAEANGWMSVTYGNGLFVAVTQSGTNQVMTSPDGITWTAQSAANTNLWYAVTYGNGLFVAVSSDGTDQVMTSPDGITWTPHAVSETNAWKSITYGNGLFVALAYGGTNQVMTSPDGITWTSRVSAAEGNGWASVTYGNGLFVAVSDDGTNRVMTSGKSFTSALAHNNIYQGGMSVLGGAFNIGTTTSATNPARNNIFNVASTTGASLFTITSSGRVGIGTSTPESQTLAIHKTGLTGAVTGGIKEYLNFTNSTQSAVYYGDNAYIVNAPTATSTLVGSMLRIEDSTTLGNTVRGLEVQAHRGTNTKGENTALSGFARTFGVRGTTIGDAGGTYLPAGVYAETQGTTQGNALRAYSGSITSEDLVSIFHDTSAFTGTGLQMNFGNTTGSFAATSTAKFLDLQVAGTSKFIIAANGSTTIGDGTVNAALIIGRGSICVDNDGSCISTTTGQIRSVTSALGNSDLAEMYFSSEALQTGEIVSLTGGLSIERASETSAQDILGVVSTKPGLLLGFDDTSLRAGEGAYPVGLRGRVPIRLSTENGPIHKGDRITISSIPGVGMKATESSMVVGISLEDFDGVHAYSAGFINQFGDDMVRERALVPHTEVDPRTQDGCYNGAGGAEGEETCVPTDVVETSSVPLSDTSREDALRALRAESATTTTDGHGNQVSLGQVIMFIDLGSYQLAGESDILAELASTTLLENATEGETFWTRIKMLAQNFVDGVLTLAGLKADRIETNELCVDGVCVNGEQLRALLNGAGNPNDVPVDEDDSSDDSTPDSGSEGGGDAGGDNTTSDTPPDELPTPNGEETVLETEGDIVELPLENPEDVVPEEVPPEVIQEEVPEEVTAPSNEEVTTP